MEHRAHQVRAGVEGRGDGVPGCSGLEAVDVAIDPGPYVEGHGHIMAQW
jgi:hypothetical protein